jgi:hypothetical protein
MHRQKMLASFSAWVTDPDDRPADADVALEAQGTAGAVVQIAELLGRRPE